MSFSIGLQHKQSITWLFDFTMKEPLFHSIIEYLTVYLRQKFYEQMASGKTVREVYSDFEAMFGSVAEITMNPAFITTSYFLEHGTIFFSCRISSCRVEGCKAGCRSSGKVRYTYIHNQADNVRLESMLTHANTM